MNPFQRDVRSFHEAIGAPAPSRPTLLTDERARFRERLIREEYEELVRALAMIRIERAWGSDGAEHEAKLRKHHVDVLDGICDLVYVALGTAVEMGVDVAPLWRAVHESNMRKVGGPIDAGGKQQKPSGWEPPDIETLLLEQEVP